MSLRQIDMNLLCQLWSLNETIQVIFRKYSRPPRRTLFGILGHFAPLFTCIPRILTFPKSQEFKAQQSRHSSLSPHGWLDPEEEQELDSDGSDEEEYYNQQYGQAIDG